MKNKMVPESVVMAINALLEPYGLSFSNLIKEVEEKKTNAEKQFLSIQDIEQNYSIGRFTIYRAIKASKVDAIKLSKAKSGKILVKLSSLTKWLNSCKTMVRTN